MANDTTTTEEPREAAGAPVLRTGKTPGRANLLPPWKPGQSGNPKGRPPTRRLFEEAFSRAVADNAEAIAAVLVRGAIEGDARMMTALLDRLVPRVTRHELEGEAAPSRVVLEFEPPAPRPS